jgi:tRNAThr (cytosine32-N3)-methyltransferase
LFVYCCDFSPKAVSLISEDDEFDAERCLPFCWDVSRSDVDIPVQEGSLDFILCVYVLSALSPDKHKTAIDNLVRLMRKDGILYFKDYGRHDLTQLR